MKIEVHHQAQETKGKQLLYRQASPQQLALEKRLFQVIEKPNLRLYCAGCELELTRLHHIITKNENYCVSCLTNLEEYPQDYLVRPSLKWSPTQTQWDLMDEMLLITAFRTWGYSNWNQIKEFMDYNHSAFSLEQIKEHYYKYHYDQPDNLLRFPDSMIQARPHTPYGEVTLQGYEQAVISERKNPSFKKKESKCEKKPSSNRNITANESQRSLKPSSNLGQMSVIEAESRLLAPEAKSDCPVLGYNAKRDEFETWHFDIEAEKMLDDLEFYETDTPEEHALKISLIQDYNRRLNERQKRKQFVLEYKLLDSHYQISLRPEEQNASAILQPLMRCTENHQQYKQLIDNFTAISKRQSFITNLHKVQQKATKTGSTGQAFDFLLAKRKKSITNWQQSYNKVYPDKRRKVFRKKNKEEGSIVLVEENTQEDGPPFSVQDMEKAFKSRNSQQKYEISGLKLTPFFDQEAQVAPSAPPALQTNDKPEEEMKVEAEPLEPEVEVEAGAEAASSQDPLE